MTLKYRQLDVTYNLTIEEALETTKIHSVSGLLPEGQSFIIQPLS